MAGPAGRPGDAMQTALVSRQDGRRSERRAPRLMRAPSVEVTWVALALRNVVWAVPCLLCVTVAPANGAGRDHR